MAKKLLKITETTCNVKVSGTGSSDTISLATDLKKSSETLVGSQVVNLTALTYYTSNQSDKIDILRGGDVIFTVNGCGQYDLNGNFSIADDSNSSGDLTVNITGTGGVYIGLRKVSGYASHHEPEFFGSYDNQTMAGA